MLRKRKICDILERNGFPIHSLIHHVCCFKPPHREFNVVYDPKENSNEAEVPLTKLSWWADALLCAVLGAK